EDGEQRREDGERADHADDDGGDAAVAHGDEELLLEQQETGERHGDRDAGDGDGPPGGGHGGGQGVLDRAVVPAEFFAEAADHEEPVVDREPQPQEGGDVHREDRHVGHVRQGVQGRERAEDRQAADEQRQARRDEPAEDQYEQHHEEGQGDGLGARDVGGDAVVDGRRGADRPARPGGEPAAHAGQVVADRPVGLLLGGLSVPGEFQDGVGRGPVVADEL